MYKGIPANPTFVSEPRAMPAIQEANGSSLDSSVTAPNVVMLVPEGDAVEGGLDRKCRHVSMDSD